MIEDKDSKIVVAESDLEAYWLDVKRNADATIDSLKKQLLLNEEVSLLASRKASEAVVSDEV